MKYQVVKVFAEYGRRSHHYESPLMTWAEAVAYFKEAAPYCRHLYIIREDGAIVYET